MHLVVFVAILLFRNRPNALGAMLFCTSKCFICLFIFKACLFFSIHVFCLDLFTESWLSPFSKKIVILAALSEPLNGIGRRHWRTFSDEDYFDTHGVFMSLVWALPLLMNAALTVVSCAVSLVSFIVVTRQSNAGQNRDGWYPQSVYLTFSIGKNTTIITFRSYYSGRLSACWSRSNERNFRRVEQRRKNKCQKTWKPQTKKKDLWRIERTCLPTWKWRWRINTRRKRILHSPIFFLHFPSHRCSLISNALLGCW